VTRSKSESRWFQSLSNADLDQHCSAPCYPYGGHIAPLMHHSLAGTMRESERLSTPARSSTSILRIQYRATERRGVRPSRKPVTVYEITLRSHPLAECHGGISCVRAASWAR
jgi:hypothetical protein